MFVETSYNLQFNIVQYFEDIKRIYRILNIDNFYRILNIDNF